MNNTIQINILDAGTIFHTLDFALRNLKHGEEMSIGQYELVGKLVQQVNEEFLQTLKSMYPVVFREYESANYDI
jgi:hypothetical protein